MEELTGEISIAVSAADIRTVIEALDRVKNVRKGTQLEIYVRDPGTISFAIRNLTVTVPCAGQWPWRIATGIEDFRYFLADIREDPITLAVRAGKLHVGSQMKFNCKLGK